MKKGQKVKVNFVCSRCAASILSNGEAVTDIRASKKAKDGLNVIKTEYCYKLCSKCFDEFQAFIEPDN